MDFGRKAVRADRRQLSGYRGAASDVDFVQANWHRNLNLSLDRNRLLPLVGVWIIRSRDRAPRDHTNMAPQSARIQLSWSNTDSGLTWVEPFRAFTEPVRADGFLRSEPAEPKTTIRG